MEYDPRDYVPHHYGSDPYSHYSFDGAMGEFDHFDPYNSSNEYSNYDMFNTDGVSVEDLYKTPVFLAAAANKYLDTTVTKFLQNDISVTKFLAQSNDVTVTKFLDNVIGHFLAASNDITVTKFLEQQADDISVTKFLDAYTVDKFLEQSADVPVTQYLEMTVI
jgi:hypothetical protein